MRILQLILVSLISVGVYAQGEDLKELEFLLGTWKMEGKETYESWEMKDSKILGESFKMKGGEKVLTETVELYFEAGEIIYLATISDQNNGKGIPFKLATVEGDLYSFENSEHDFPKKIQYQLLDETKLFVSVLGKKNKGFTFYLNKQ